ncbi:MAG: rod shape-determining protein RodA [Candidatus Thiodiazotropha sp. (ex Lucinoma aequizonata)]|nr:rod shape-determining protein RodA [Candidatus Thiodiazotropha sp. (ex Lucinoma aequizonata)]MCU7887133.1 rod shape-determining protein RodA [Candidatus Thiodiazotropha sp. (ex Lucinoma aequizonata)]MCU7896148.1 rod shape-determining protein RodA [Candidatus Thiodiazotropha sp. (ex Lucinoma aequizonata)]MCU7898254.1 rod shape-determining protein RodA [Candidatus Thiodiazotropha sp. (ex Lucinoma aequizonata)]MCU7901819.1 rod shape-determining protein RodA [Candidatus Thiodiazotropha sp. (ex L
MRAKKAYLTVHESQPAHASGLLAWLHIDLPLMTGLVLLSGVGLLILYSAGDREMILLQKQLFRLGFGFVAMVALAQIHPANIRRWSPLLYSVGIVMLLSVILFGESGKGAQRWLDLGFLRFQPSEMFKLTLPMLIAWYLADHRLPPNPTRLIMAGLFTLVPVLLIAKQPDLGTALLVGTGGAFTLFLAGISWRLITSTGLVMTALGPVAWYFMHEYQRQRVLTFLNPESDPLGTGYHIIQSKIAIGSGGISGKGWLNGTQSHLEFLPERHTDFIFAVISEEFGLVGILALLSLYLFIILRGLYIATQAQDTFGRILAGSLSLVFFVYLFVNAGMVTGLLPVVGVPLPLISYGGTSLVTILASFGMLMSIHTHKKLLPT